MQPIQFLRLLVPAAICFIYALAPNTAQGQTYYSTFPTPAGKYTVSEPSGGTCNAPAVQDAAAFADADVNNYTYFRGTISAPLTCTNNNYVFNTYLKLPVDSPYITGGLQAGFRIKVSIHINPTVLTQNLSIQTYMGNTFVESFSGSDVHLIDLATDSTRFVVYANTTKNFNRIQLTVNGNIIPLNTDFEFDVQYAIASNTDLLPVTISSFRVLPAGNTVAVSWQSLNEINISNYRIEKSSNNGLSYTTVATIPAKGGSNMINYSYTDRTVANGNYLYRIVSVDKDGSSKATNALLVTIAGKSYLVLLPSVAKAGQTIVINSGITGSYQLAVYDIQGKVVKQQQVNNGDKATISTNGLSAGTYVVKIITASGSMSQAKFIVN